jgi:pectin methylesterase-like acyl-CoA thioesterase
VGPIVGPGESIQKAINAAAAGDTILVSGVHREDVVIRKNGISLRGTNKAVILPPAKAGSPCGPSGNSFAKNKCDKSVPTRLCR